MAPTSADLLSAGWGAASGLALVLPALLALRGGRSRPWGAFAFGLALLAWGAQAVAANLASLATDPTLAAALHLASFGFLLPLPFLLLSFAAEQGPRGRARWLPRLALVPSALALGLLLVAPRTVLRGIDAEAYPLVPLWTPAYAWLVLVPFFGALTVALVVLARRLRRAPTPRTAARAATLLAGLGLAVGFSAGSNLGYYGAWALADPQGAPGGFTLLFLLMALGVLAVGVRLLVDARAARDPAAARRHRLVALAVLAPLAWGAAEGALQEALFPRLDTVGLWRLAGAGVLAYGLLRWRVHDLPERARHLAPRAAGVAGGLAGGVAGAGAGFALAGGPVAPLLGALVAGSAFALPAVRLARRLLGTPEPAAPAEDDMGPRIEAYRAALEASLARGMLEEDETFLAALRERFGIGAEAHRVILHYARSAVVVAQGGARSAVYERLRLLGEGGAGRTWLARDRVHDRLVVLKEPLGAWQDDEALRDAVLHEARMAARVRHPHVVGIDEVVMDGRVPVLVMEHVDGGSLADLLRRRGPLPPPEAARILAGVLAGVEAIHAAGVVHRDVKPTNVLLTRDGAPKVADFGIAVPLRSGRTQVLSPADTPRGTLGYVAPEVRSGAMPADARADVYGCAALLHECLTGAPPPDGPLPASPAIPPSLHDLLQRALSADPARRPPGARAFADELAKVMPP